MIAPTLGSAMILCTVLFTSMVPPAPPRFPDVRTYLPEQMPQLGGPSKDLWSFAENWTNFNHGSYGAVPQAVLDVQRDWIRAMERNPEMFIRFWQYGLQEQVLAKLAKFMGANASDIVFVDNASHGVNAVLRSLAERLPRGSKVLKLNLAYAMVQNTLRYCAGVFDEAIVTANVTYKDPEGHPQPSDFTDAVQGALKAHGGAIKLVSISHITSLPALVLPVAEIAALVRAHGAMLLVDGAHALGQIPIDVGSLGADFYVANGHKWLYSPKGSAVLWVRPSRQSLIYPTTISQEGQGSTRFQRDFSYQGTDDPTAFLAMAAAIDFRAALPGGHEAAFQYPAQLAATGGARLAQMWGTDVLEPAGMRGFLTNVRLPTSNGTEVSRLTDVLLSQYGTYVVCEGDGEVTPSRSKSRYWMRISSQVYLDRADFEWLGNAVLDILRK